MSNQTLDVSESPKNQFNSFLLNLLRYAAFYIYIRCDDAKGLNVLDGIIDTLSLASQEKLIDIHDKIFEGAYGKPADAREYYAKVSAFLAKTYLTEKDVPAFVIETRLETRAPGVAQTVLKEAREGGYGSIMIGRRGISRTKRFLFGSVSNKIVQEARDMAVWVVC